MTIGSCSATSVGILGGHLVQHVGDPLLVAAALRRDREAVHRHRELERPHVNLVLVVRVVQHAVERDLVDLRHRGEIAGHRAVDLDVLAALQHEQMADLEALASLADVELRLLRHRALVHAEDAQLADERVHHDLEHVCEHVLLRIGHAAKFGGVVTFALDEQRRVALGRIGRELDEHVEQFGHARAGARGDEAHRHEVPVAQRLLERRVQLLRRDLALLEVFRHQLFVDLDHLVDERLVRRRHRREIALARRIEEAVDHPLAAVGRQVDRQALLAERLLDLREHVGEIDVLGVDAVHDDQPAQAPLARPLHHPRRDHLHARARVDDHRGRLDRVERADRLADEIGKARRVDQVDARPLRLEVEQRRAQRVLVLLLQRVEVADRRAALDAAARRHRAGLDQQRFGQRRFARRTVADERDGADVLRGELRHVLSSFEAASASCVSSENIRARRRGRATATPRPDR